MTETKTYLERAEDGVLQVASGPNWSKESYKDPGEAIRTWWAGERRFGCTHRSFSQYRSHPCGNAAKHDPDHNGNPTKCGHHSQAAIDRREAKKRARDAERRAKWDYSAAVRKHNQERDEIIRRIAEGHNDPRGLCQDWIDRTPKKEPNT